MWLRLFASTRHERETERRTQRWGGGVKAYYCVVVKAVEVQRFVSSFTSGKRVSVSELDAEETLVPGGGWGGGSQLLLSLFATLTADEGTAVGGGRREKGQTLIENRHEKTSLPRSKGSSKARQVASDSDMLLFPPLKTLSVSLL